MSTVFGLFDFSISITVENFHISGKYESLSVALKMQIIRMGL